MSDLCQPCVEGNHAACEIWTCHCLHAACPTEAQMTIDDALTQEDR